MVGGSALATFIQGWCGGIVIGAQPQSGLPDGLSMIPLISGVGPVAINLLPDWLAYERFGRAESNMDMRIRYHAPVGDHFFTVTPGGGALEKLEIQMLQPQVAETIGSDLRLTFSVTDTGPDHAIWIGLQPRSAGRIHVVIHGSNASQIRFTQWIYP